MASPEPLVNEDERLPLILGFQRVAENTSQLTRFLDRGRGIYLYDTDGREYIEATSSFYVAALGYQNEELIDAITAQLHELPFCVSALHRTSQASLALSEKLVDILPVDNAHVLYGSTGSEANDFLIKMLRFGAVARGEPGRNTIIGRHASYHGGTLATASLTGGHHEEFGLPIEGFRHVAQPDYHGAREAGESEADYVARLVRELEDLIAAEPRDSIAAFLTEPVSFSAGFRVPPAGYFEGLLPVLDAHGIEFVADEVVTGYGRLGSWWGSDAMGLKPRHATFGKAVTSGYFPFSIVALGADLYRDLERGSEQFGTLAHAGTFSAHPVGAAAGLKVLEIIERENLVEHARQMGERLRDGLMPFAAHPKVGEIRSMGLGAALDFLVRDDNDEIVNNDADAVMTTVYERLLDAGVVSRPAGRSIVLAPPLIIEPGEVDEIVARVGRVLETLGD